MKLTKSGEIEACSERCRDRGYEWIGIRGKRVIIWQPEDFGSSYLGPINFCPNCGAKTEIEGD